jgi:hypothetical protein
LNNFKYIEKRTFEIFFKNNNTLDIRNNPLNCSDINKFEWILQQRNQLKDKIFANCNDGRDIWDLWDSGSIF